ncbi:hypothetical protein ACWEO4_45865 [Streptomyces sp. NPDC004393]
MGRVVRSESRSHDRDIHRTDTGRLCTTSTPDRAGNCGEPQ